MFARPDEGDALTQGDVIDDCPLVGLDLSSAAFSLSDPSTMWWAARVIVLTQACDLAQTKGDSVLVAPVVYDAQGLVDAGVLKSSLIRDQMRRHLVYGWYFLPASSTSIAESLANLRDVHSVPRTVLEQLAARGKRPARLASPYREHLAQHFAVTYMRIALPEQYASQP